MATAPAKAPAKAKSERFAYTARNARGAIVNGQITADSETNAAKRLQAMGLAPLTVRNAKSAQGFGDITIMKKKVKAKTLALFCRQFATMIKAGLPLVRAIQAMTDQSEHPELKRVLPLIQVDLAKGVSFSQALEKHTDVFPPLMVGMVMAGEASGSLGETMDSVSEVFQKQAALRSKVIGAMIYPGIVLGMALFMVTIMLIFVVPRFAEIFMTLGGELPLPTRLMVMASDIAKFAVPVLIVFGVIFSFWWKKNKNSRQVRDIVDPLKLKIPIFGKFFQKVYIARFSRTFASLLDSGVPLIQAIDITADTTGSVVVSDGLMAIQREVAAGKPIATPMGDYPVFPPLLVQMVATGEETGALPEMLTKTADFYEKEVEAAAEGLSATLEPIMIMLLALVVGGMVVALYLPIFSVFDLIKA